MKILTKLQKEITKYKKNLQKKLDKGIIYENFGMTEYRELHNKYNIYSNIEWVSTMERDYAQNLIRQFGDWCMNATPSY